MLFLLLLLRSERCRGMADKGRHIQLPASRREHRVDDWASRLAFDTPSLVSTKISNDKNNAKSTDDDNTNNCHSSNNHQRHDHDPNHPNRKSSVNCVTSPQSPGDVNNLDAY